MDKWSARRKWTASTISAVFLWVGFLGISACAPIANNTEADNEEVVEEVVNLYQPQQGIDSKQRFRLVLELLATGNAAAARSELELYLQGQPTSSRAQDLLVQIDTPVAEYFPPDFRELTLSSGQSLSSVAKTFLGSIYKFHALAKYNGISEPGKIGAGQTIRVPLTQHALEVFQTIDSTPLEETQEQVPQTIVESLTDEPPTTPEATEPPTVESTLLPAEIPEVSSDDSSSRSLDLPATPDLEEMHLEALNAYRAQDLSKAIELWNRVLEIDPDYESSRLYRSQAIKLQNKLRNFD